MKTINYKIQFHSYWHCGSGQAAGAKADAVVIKDLQKLPFVPGKTLKGLVREQVEMMDEVGQEDIDAMFGQPADKASDIKSGCSHFSNATLSKEEREQIAATKQQEYLYKNIASTAIDSKTGIAKDGSLRSMEVVVPCKLEGTIANVPDDMAAHVIEALKMIKRMGMNRNRGLGRCDIEGKEVEA